MAKRIFHQKVPNGKMLWRHGSEIGAQYGKLTVLEPMRLGKNQKLEHLCRCDCGNERWSPRDLLEKGAMKACRPCSARRPHVGGMNKTSRCGNEAAHNSWYNARDRCTNPLDNAWKNYGGRGIIMCEEWIDNFDQFLSDMGPRPKGSTLDRIDNNKGYNKENCRWADKRTQILNRRNIVFTEINGKPIAAADIFLKTGLESLFVRNRIASGLNGNQIITEAIEALERLLKS